MIKEYDRVVLTEDLPDENLKAGDVGTVVMIYGDHEGYELEFFNLCGETIAVVTAYTRQVRPVDAGEISHARPLAAA